MAWTKSQRLRSFYRHARSCDRSEQSARLILPRMGGNGDIEQKAETLDHKYVADKYFQDKDTDWDCVTW